MDTALLTDDQVATVCGLGESHFYDRKSTAIRPTKLTKTLSAFANADGGELHIGIEDSGVWRGFKTVEDFNGHIQALNALFPYGSEFDYEFLQHPTHKTFVLRITVLKARDVKYASDGKAYVRRGAQSLECASIEMLQRQKGLTTHEVERINYDSAELMNSLVTVGFMVQVVPDAEPDAWLKKQRLIIDGLPTVAGTILFHDEPQIHLPKASVKLYRYTTSDAEGSRGQLAYDPMSIEGCLYDVIKKAVQETVRQVEEIPILESSGFTEIRYPREALHEIITNALLHRDYGVNDDVHVRIFDNRIEVQSPGNLPANITPRNILDERFARNPMVVRLINKFPDAPNKDVGEGLNTAFAAMRSLELKDPEISDTGSSVVVRLRHEALASPESRIVGHLKVNDSINNREARALLNTEADRSVRRLFEKLVAAGEIERVPGTTRGGSRYRLLRSSGTAR